MQALKKYLLLSALVFAVGSVQSQSAGHMGRWIAVQGHLGIDALNFDFSLNDLVPYTMAGGTVELFASKHVSFGFDITHTKLEYASGSGVFRYLVEDREYDFWLDAVGINVTRLGGHARVYTTRAPAPIGFFMEFGMGQTRYSFNKDVIRNISIRQPVENTGQLLSITPSNYYSFISGHVGIGWQWFFKDRIMLTPMVSGRFLPSSPRDIIPSSFDTMLEGFADQDIHSIGRLQLAIKIGYLIY